MNKLYHDLDLKDMLNFKKEKFAVEIRKKKND